MLLRLLAFLFVLTAFPSSEQTILVHAHRGGRATRPENTIPAFEYAIKSGTDVLELDLAVTMDNVLVVSHSPYLIQPAATEPWMKAVLANERHCAGPELPPGTVIHSLTLAQLKQYDCGATTLPAFPHQVAVPHTTIPTFDEVLDLAPQGTFEFNVETKIFPNHPELTPTPEVFVKMIDDAVRQRHLESRVILQSFDFRTLRAMKQLDPKIRLSALFGQAKYDALMGLTDPDKNFTHIAEVSGAGILSPDESLVTPGQVTAAHKAGLQVAPYTVNTTEGWQKMADAQVDAIITDDPVGLLDWLRSQKTRYANSSYRESTAKSTVRIRSRVGPSMHRPEWKALANFVARPAGARKALVEKDLVGNETAEVRRSLTDQSLQLMELMVSRLALAARKRNVRVKRPRLGDEPARPGRGDDALLKMEQLRCRPDISEENSRVVKNAD